MFPGLADMLLVYLGVELQKSERLGTGVCRPSTLS